MLTRLYDVFFRRSRATNSEVSGGILPKFELMQAFIVVLITSKNEEILPKFELIQAFMVVLVTCKNEEDPIKNEGARVLTRFSPL